MAFEIQAEQDFTLVQLNDVCSAEDIVLIVEQLTEGLLDTPYVVVEPFLNEEISDDVWEAWKDVDALIDEHNGLLIFVAGGRPFEEAVNNADLTYIPSYDEAVDYIFMDRLEKEMDAEMGEEE